MATTPTEVYNLTPQGRLQADFCIRVFGERPVNRPVRAGHRPIYQIAQEIEADWTRIPKDYREAYLNPLFTLNSVDDDYIADSAKSVILTFLGNATGWRGETARRLKAELKEMVK